MKYFKPQIDFRHVLAELSVNRSDPCEVVRELISNSYDALAKNILFSPLEERNGIIFFDDGLGLDTEEKINDITPWEAFFSIGKSTKKKGNGIGYKCQGTKLCFACSRILVATRSGLDDELWQFKLIENPRNNLDASFDISPAHTSDVETTLRDFYSPRISAETDVAIKHLLKFINRTDSKTGTLVVIDNLDTEDFRKHFTFGKQADQSYIFNYIRFYTRHGDIRQLTKKQGFTPNHIKQVSPKINEVSLHIYSNKNEVQIPFGFHYLDTDNHDLNVKLPSQVSRLRDGRFFTRAAKSFSLGSSKYSIVMAIDGNRRAHEEYKYLDRKGKAISGIRLGDHRGVFISVKGIKICKYHELLALIPDYKVLCEGDSQAHYLIILDGDFDLVTNRNSLSTKSFDTLSDPNFIKEIKKFLDEIRRTDKVFSELLARLKKESTENLLNDQIELFNTSRDKLKDRERFRIKDASQETHFFLSPEAGEEYLVGVLYAVLSNLVPKDLPFVDYWRKVLTFSTQGIDSLAMKDSAVHSPLATSNIVSMEYKYEFSNWGPFNHALAVVNYIVAWKVDVDTDRKVRDTFTCFGGIRKHDNPFEWEINAIENDEGGQYDHTVKVICLKTLIEVTFPGVKFT